MNINLATIDFCPGQGGEAVIRPLDVTENGTYRAPAGIDGYSPVSVNVSGGGSITPEEQAALDTLVDNSDGVLYTKSLPYLKRILELGIYLNVPQLSKVGDDVYYNDLSLYKYNNNTYSFDYICSRTYSTGTALWKDLTGRLYDGSYGEINIETGEETQLANLNIDFYYESGRCNVYTGQYGTWNISSTLRKFNETTQEFESGYTLNAPAGWNYSWVLYWFKYNNHILQYSDSKTYELKEYEDHIDIVEVTGEYFTTPSNITEGRYIASTASGDLFIFYGMDKYKYNKTSGVWESINITSEGVTDFYYNYVVSGDILIGGAQPNTGYWQMNLGSDINKTMWSPVNNVAVDLKSSQQIRGEKSFEGVSVRSLRINENMQVTGANQSMYYYGNFTIGGNRLSGNGNLNFDVPGSFTLNNDDIATVNECIVNTTETPTGPKFKNICQVPGNLNRDRVYETPSGRIIYIDTNIPAAYEFDGTQFVQLQSVTNFPTSTYRATISDGLFVLSGQNLYRWDDTSSDFILEIQMGEATSPIWAADANTLRSGSTFKLVNNGSSYEWVSDSTGWQDWIFSYNVGQDIYLRIYQEIYTWDESTKTPTRIGMLWASVSNDNMFAFDGKLYYISFAGNVSVRKVDPSAAGTDQFDVLTNILVPNFAYDYSWVEYNGNLYTQNNMNFGYTYDGTSSVPEVPAADGTYTLKAVRSSGVVTYSWVLDI